MIKIESKERNGIPPNHVDVSTITESTEGVILDFEDYKKTVKGSSAFGSRNSKNLEGSRIHIQAEGGDLDLAEFPRRFSIIEREILVGSRVAYMKKRRSIDTVEGFDLDEEAYELRVLDQAALGREFRVIIRGIEANYLEK